jgi:hypothetical protein
MTQHYTKNTVEASSWCNPCGKDTPHAVFGGRVGSCLSCMKRLELLKPLPGMENPKEPEQMTIAECYGTVDIG